jgi:helicase
MAFIAVRCDKLDGDRQQQARPDFLIVIEDFTPIVVEVKSRASETDFVTLNAASEVLAASELIGMRANPCLTVCNPGVDPSVPGVIESCGRLCVVDSSDLVEAVLRIREGTLTHEGLFNWLTAPGIALREDIPHPR